MKLTYTNQAFTHHSVPMPGVPVLLTNDMKIAEGPQRWLFYQLLLGHASLHTTSTYLSAVRLEPQLLSGSINDLYQALQ